MKLTLDQLWCPTKIYASYWLLLEVRSFEAIFKIFCRADFEVVEAKGQIISEWNFGVFKSPKKSTQFKTDFCPMKVGQKSVKNLVGFLGDLKTPKIYSEINWPLKEAFWNLGLERLLLTS